MINTKQQDTLDSTDNYKDSLLSETNTSPELLQPHKSTQNRFDGLQKIDVIAYGMGHFINDMTATCWFNYMLFFLTEVVHTSAAPYAILAGQIADGIATPIVGILSDKTKTKIGQRKPWYIVGYILLVCGFLPAFQNFSTYSNNKQMQVVYYIFFSSLLNTGWAGVQISHMSLVPSLSCSRKRRDKLNNLRNSFTFLANLTVLALGLILFSTMSNRTLQINLISYIVIILGSITSIFFIWRINEPKLTEICSKKSIALKAQLNQKLSPSRKISDSHTQFSEDDNMNIHASQKKNIRVAKWYDWFKMASFYIFGIAYTGVRLYCNVFGTLLPFYLVYVLKMGSQQVDKIPFTMALVQLLVYISSVCTSFFLTTIYEKFGRKNALLFGGVLCVIGALGMVFLTNNISWPVYVLALVVGMAQSITLSTGINLISEVIGTKSKQGAIVFGVYSLLDKFSSGIILFLVSNSSLFSDRNVMFIRLTTIVIPSGGCILSCILAYLTPIKQYSKNNKFATSRIRKSSIQEELVV